jgi:hypothetical protein
LAVRHRRREELLAYRLEDWSGRQSRLQTGEHMADGALAPTLSQELLELRELHELALVEGEVEIAQPSAAAATEPEPQYETEGKMHRVDPKFAS